jgi:hypothetical protein
MSKTFCHSIIWRGLVEQRTLGDAILWEYLHHVCLSSLVDASGMNEEIKVLDRQTTRNW